MKKDQHSPETLTALLCDDRGFDTPVKNSLCCEAAGINALPSSTTEVLTPHEKLREAATTDATLNAQERPPAQPFVGYKHASDDLNALPDPKEDRRYLVLPICANPAEQQPGANFVLAHCPFCGQQDAFVEQLDSDASVVVCQGRISEHSACLARGPVGVQQDDCEDQPGHDKAVEEWNRRAAEQHQSNMVSTKFRQVSHPDGHAWVVRAGDKNHRAALRASHLSIATLYTTTPLRTVIVNHLDVALAEFLRGKMKRLHGSYSLAFEAGWHARSTTEIEQIMVDDREELIGQLAEEIGRLGMCSAAERELFERVIDANYRKRGGEPTAVACAPDVYGNGKSICLVDIPKDTAEVICRNISAVTGCKVDWHYIGGRVHIKAMTPPEQHAPKPSHRTVSPSAGSKS